jgi:WD40 repeat protein
MRNNMNMQINLTKRHTLGTGKLILLLTIVSGVAQAQSPFNLIRKIKVDEKGAAGACDGCAFSHAGDILAVSDNAGFTKLYRVADGSFIRQVEHMEEYAPKASAREINAIHFTPNDKCFLTGMNDTGCKIWETETGKMIKNLGRGYNTDGAAFAPNGKWVAVGEQQTARIYNWPDCNKVAEFTVGYGKTRGVEVNSVDWSDDSAYLLLGGDGEDVAVLRTSDWSVVHRKKFGKDRVKSVRFSPDGTMFVASGQNGQVFVYSMATGEMIADLKHASETVALPGDDDDGDEPNVEAVEWSADGKYLFTGGLYSGIIRAWRVADWSMIAWAQGQEYNRQIEFIAVNKKNLVATCGDEGYVYLFQFTPLPEKDPIDQSGAEQIVIEAEDFDANLPMNKYRWDVVKDETASGGKKVQALPDLEKGKGSHGMDKDFATGDPAKDSPKLDYRIHITDAGTYKVYVRAAGEDHYANSYHIGLNGEPVQTADRMENLGSRNEWIWSNDTKDNDPATLTFPKAGLYTLNLWMREDGVQVDKMVLMKDGSSKPKELGPVATERKKAPKEAAFQRLHFETQAAAKATESAVVESGRFQYVHEGFKNTPMIPGTKWKLHQVDRPQPPRVIPGTPVKESCVGVPSDALLIFDGKSMDQFVENSTWTVKDGVLVAGKNFLATKKAFGDCQLHLEWRTPVKLSPNIGLMGNSGVILMSLYEVQVYDSYTAKIYPDGSAAATYGQTPPLVNACRAPGQWQSYDIIFTAPVFENDKLVEPARVTVLHNGILVQKDTEFMGPTAHRQINSYSPHPSKLPLALKGETTPVEFRNIWIREL